MKTLIFKEFLRWDLLNQKRTNTIIWYGLIRLFEFASI